MQKEIVAEIEAYQNEIAKLQLAIKEEEMKIQAAIARIWGEDESAAPEA